jgi:capsular polysaccharide biosynthesis protein
MIELRRLRTRYRRTWVAARSLKRAFETARRWLLHPYAVLLARSYSPIEVLRTTEGTGITFHRVGTSGAPSACVVADVPSGMVFTDRSHNVTVSQRQVLIPLVSWQYAGHDDVVLDDEQNHLLTRRTMPLRHPYRFRGTVGSLLTGGGSSNYYHWLFDALPRFRLIRDYLNGDPDAYLTENGKRFQRETLALLGLHGGQIVSAGAFPFIAADRVIATSHPNPDSGAIPGWIVSFLRSSFSCYGSNRAFGPFVYLSRRDAAHRRLVNEQELLAHLEPLGFTRYDLSDLSVPEQISLFSRASVIIGVHGAGLANLVFARASAAVFELFSADYRPLIFPQISRYIGLRHECILCDPVDGGETALQSDFRITARQIARLIDGVRAHSTAR